MLTFTCVQVLSQATDQPVAGKTNLTQRDCLDSCVNSTGFPANQVLIPH